MRIHFKDGFCLEVGVSLIHEARDQLYLDHTVLVLPTGILLLICPLFIIAKNLQVIILQ